MLVKEEKVKVGDWNINYVKVGTGPHVLLCMPGTLGTLWSAFKPQIEGLNRDKFTVVAWDPPGYGKSRPPLREFSTDVFEKEAACAYEFMKALNIPKFSLLGWSSGGRSSMILSAKHPDAVNKLVIFGTNSYIHPEKLEVLKKLKDTNEWSHKMKEPMVEEYGEELFRTYWFKWVDGLINLCDATDGEICTHVLKDIKCPTLILHGEKDIVVNRVQALHLHTHIEGSRFHSYPDGKHNMHLKYAEDFNKTVEEFLLS